MIRILVADDHPIVSAGLKKILSGMEDMHVSDVVASGEEVLEKVSRNEYDVVLLDISMPGRGGIDTLKQLRTNYSDIAVLVLSSYPEDQYGMRVLKAGAAGYMTKHCATDKLIEAIRKVYEGGKYISPFLAERLATEISVDLNENPHERLSDREYLVMRMIASGKTLKEIADELSLSAKTITTYRSRILEKMNMHSNSEITQYVTNNRIA